MDNAGNFLYRNLNGSICLGLNYSSYSSSWGGSDGLSYNPFAPRTYDAAVVLAQGFHYALESGEMPYIIDHMPCKL